MDRAWKILGIIVLITAIYAGWEHRAAEAEIRTRVELLAEQLDPALWDFHRSPKLSSSDFLRLLVALDAAAKPNSARLFFASKAQPAGWYVDEALSRRKVSLMQAQLVRSSLLTALEEAEKDFAVLNHPGSREAMERGEEPTINDGPFLGQKLKVGWRVSPVVLAEAINHPANLTLQPEPVWALQQDRLDPDGYQDAQAMHSAGVIDELAWIRVEAYWKDANKKNK